MSEANDGTENDPFTISAHKAFNIKYVRRDKTIEESPTHKPTFVHQMFQDENIVGYKGLVIDVYQTSGSFFTYLNIRFEEKKPKAPFLAKQLEDFIPKKYTSSLAEFEREAKKDFRPLGNKIHEYKFEKDGITETFEVFLVTFDNPLALAFLDRLQINSFWNIENASYIEAEEDNNWEMITIYKKNPEDIYELVAYSTIYFFYAYPDRQRLRISQIVVLPEHRRRGHATTLLKTIYQYGESKRVVEFTVEDISDEFRAVRAIVDIKNIQREGIWTTFDKLTLDKETVKQIQEKLFLHKKQIVECYEILKLQATNMDDAGLYREYRLMIKRRLYSQQIGGGAKEELSEEDQEKIKQGLQDIYFDTERLYRKIILKLEQ